MAVVYCDSQSRATGEIFPRNFNRAAEPYPYVDTIGGLTTNEAKVTVKLETRFGDLKYRRC